MKKPTTQKCQHTEGREKRKENKEKPALSSQRVWKESVQQDRILLASNHSTSVKHYDKNCGPTSTDASKGQVGSLDFHPHEAITRCPNAHIQLVSENRVSSREPGLLFYPCRVVMQSHPCHVSEDHVGSQNS